MALAAGATTRRARPEPTDRGSRHAPVSALGHRRAAFERAVVVVAVHRTAARRRLSAAGEPRLPGVLHLLSAPDPRVAIARAPLENIVDELEYLTTHAARPYVVFRDPLFTQRPGPLPGALRRDSLARRCRSGSSARPGWIASTRRSSTRCTGPVSPRSASAWRRSSAETLQRAGRRPIPASNSSGAIIAECRRRGIVTAAFYVFGFLQDDWSSIAATIDYAIELGSTVAQFKLLTPYPGTPMWKQLAPLVYEKDWQRFDGFTPDVHAPVAERRRAAVPAGRGVHALLHAAVVPRRTTSGCRIAAAGCSPVRRLVLSTGTSDRERATMAQAVTC